MHFLVKLCVYKKLRLHYFVKQHTLQLHQQFVILNGFEQFLSYYISKTQISACTLTAKK